MIHFNSLVHSVGYWNELRCDFAWCQFNTLICLDVLRRLIIWNTNIFIINTKLENLRILSKLNTIQYFLWLIFYNICLLNKLSLSAVLFKYIVVYALCTDKGITTIATATGKQLRRDISIFVAMIIICLRNKLQENIIRWDHQQ